MLLLNPNLISAWPTGRCRCWPARSACDRFPHTCTLLPNPTSNPSRPPALLANAFSAPDALYLAQAQAGPPSPALFGSPTTAGLRTPPYAAARHARSCPAYII